MGFSSIDFSIAMDTRPQLKTSRAEEENRRAIQLVGALSQAHTVAHLRHNPVFSPGCVLPGLEASVSQRLLSLFTQGGSWGTAGGQGYQGDKLNHDWMDEKCGWIKTRRKVPWIRRHLEAPSGSSEGWDLQPGCLGSPTGPISPCCVTLDNVLSLWRSHNADL